jgi:hypothetical protein
MITFIYKIRLHYYTLVVQYYGSMAAIYLGSILADHE